MSSFRRRNIQKKTRSNSSNVQTNSSMA